jgi:uncharacterized protein
MKPHLSEKGIQNVLIVVAKQPTPGVTKTRLSPPLSPEQAASLYECFLLDTLDLVRKIQGIQPVIAYLPEEASDYFTGLAPDFDLLLQSGRNLGERLDHALTHYLNAGYRNVVIMDSDSPTLPSSCLSAAFKLLNNGSDVVIGPCEDGGYYLIGIKKPHPRLLREVRMSTPQVTADTLAMAAEEGLRVGLLPTWYDVDNHLSLQRLYAELSHGPVELARNTRCALNQPTIRGLLTLPGNQIARPNPEIKPISSS